MRLNERAYKLQRLYLRKICLISKRPCDLIGKKSATISSLNIIDIHYSSEKNSRKVPEKKMELKNGKCVVRKVLTEMWNRILEQCSQMELNIRKVSKEKRRWN